MYSILLQMMYFEKKSVSIVDAFFLIKKIISNMVFTMEQQLIDTFTDIFVCVL